jgi:uncharacterized FlgJ-related protein
MDKKNTKIIIVAIVVIIASLGVAYFLDFSKWKEISNLDSQIVQAKASIEAKKSYYSVIDSKMEALNSAGWSSKKESIAVNFTSTPFFIPKINTFFQTMVLASGMNMGGITSSAATSIKSTAQTTIQADSGTKSTKSTKASETTTTTSTSVATTYFDQLQGSVKKTTVNLNITGTYNAFKNLLSQFENQTRIITIKSVAVSPSGQNASTKGAVKNNLSFSMVLDVYSY